VGPQPDRNVGSDGGQTLTWTGRLVIIGAVTTAWDAAHSVIAAMGDRFVIICADSSSGRVKSASKAIQDFPIPDRLLLMPCARACARAGMLKAKV
jgi:hypothetical protein